MDNIPCPAVAFGFAERKYRNTAAGMVWSELSLVEFRRNMVSKNSFKVGLD